MTKVAEKIAPPLNNNLKNWKSFRGAKALAPGEKPNLTEAPKLGEEIPKADITNQAKILNEASEVKPEQTAKPAEPASKSSSSEILSKAANVAKAIAKAPVLPIIVPTDTKKIEAKIKDIKTEAPAHFIKKPAVIFIEGFSMFGVSNGDGIKDMADNYPGAKKFSWEEHGKIMDEIKKHAADQPVVLIGHSFGGDTAIEVANELNSPKNGFRSVDLLVSIDAVGMNKTIIPVNVKSNLNYFGEGLLPFVHGDPTVARNTKYTDVTNELRADMHSKMDDNPEVQFEIFNKINDILGAHGEEDIFIEISETNQIKDVLEAIKNSL